LPEPIEGVSLEDKLAVTQFLSGAGANINELNTVRKQLSRIKGGGLARACRAHQLVTLIISDVPGDPLDIIGSGPTVSDTSMPADALAILDRYQARQAGIAPAAIVQLEARRQATTPAAPTCQVHNVVIGNNATAVEAAAFEAERRGYIHAMTSSPQPEGLAEDVGRHLADMAWHMGNHAGPNCLVSGGEPVVQLAPAHERGRGGRNQQLVLAALLRLQELLPTAAEPPPLVLLSGGTDGEDGPTDAAGAWCTPQLLIAAVQLGLNLPQHQRRNDAYTAFEQLGTLLKTGPTDTNVCDLRVVLVEREGEPQ
jgi:hydroxypyruvate reductase